MTSRNLGHRAPLLWLVVPFIAGLTVGKLGDFAPLPWLLAAALGCGLIAIAVCRRSPRGWGAALAASMILAGTASYTLHRARTAAWSTWAVREARTVIKIDRVFSSSIQGRASGLATIVRTDDHLRELAGQHIYFSLTLRKGEAAPIRSAVLAMRGVLEIVPRDPPADSFEGYLAGAGVNFRLRRGQVLSVEQSANAYYRFCAAAAEKFGHTLTLGIGETYPRLAGLLRAMMLGETHELSTEQRTLFMQSGTMHLFAISGLNIGVIAGALLVILRWLRLPSWAQFAVSTTLLWLFVDITGASPSAIRAFVMATFVQGAFVLRRPANPIAALVASAFAVLLIAPLQVFSASFLMSYAIVAALFLLGGPLSEAWQERWKPWRDFPEVTWVWWQRATAKVWHAGAVAAAVGVASTLVGLLTGVQYFRLLTPGSLFTNILLIPTAGAATLGGFASLLCGLVGFVPGAIACNYVSAALMGLIELLVRLSVQVPGSSLAAKFSAAWIGPVSLAVLLAVMVAGYAGNWQRRATGWWAPFTVVAVVLIFGVNYGE